MTIGRRLLEHKENRVEPSFVSRRQHVLHNLLYVSQAKQDPQAGFNVETLQVCILDLIEAGTETAATTLRWSFVFLLNYPAVQGGCCQ